jgi:hypothetical protein
MKRRLLSLYALAMCQAIWMARRVLPPANVEPIRNILLREWEWQGWHYCEVCRRGGKHRFISWNDEDVTTAECLNCHFEATL